LTLSKAKRLAAAEAAVLRPGYVVANLDDFIASVAANTAGRPYSTIPAKESQPPTPDAETMIAQLMTESDGGGGKFEAGQQAGLTPLISC